MSNSGLLLNNLLNEKLYMYFLLALPNNYHVGDFIVRVDFCRFVQVFELLMLGLFIKLNLE